MSETDTWSKLQEHKRKHENLKERLAKRRKERQDLLADIKSEPLAVPEQVIKKESNEVKQKIKVEPSDIKTPIKTETSKGGKNADKKVDATHHTEDFLRLLSLILCDKSLTLPASLDDISKFIEKRKPKKKVPSLASITAVLEKLEAQNLVTLKKDSPLLQVVDCEFLKLQALHGSPLLSKVVSKLSEDEKSRSNSQGNKSKDGQGKKSKDKKQEVDEHKEAIQSLLSMPTMKEVENKKLGNEILDLLNQPTAKEQSLVEKFKSQGGAMVKEFCPFGTREECRRSNTEKRRCKKLHFRKIIQGHTDEFLGDCSFLNTCFHMDTCKYVHYEVDSQGLSDDGYKSQDKNLVKKNDLIGGKITMIPAQWVQCDVRYLDFEVLGKFSVVMADPPWDIHMELPYGTMSDQEMRFLPVSKLQDDGYIFLWVTGRAIELGRECLQNWGYSRCDELIWVKTNQLQRLIRTGRTGHWINHGKEHCIIGVKGKPSPALFNKGLDCDVLVSEVRDTSHKPDEIYGIIERLAPGQRKIELFGRMHNVQPNWITLGNQLSGVNLHEIDVVNRFQIRYPSGSCMEKPQQKPIPTVIELTPQQGGDM